jgi:EAL domain-containing protein (putative c-di-GMP-specific phosphodiesterase class I)
MTQTARAVPAMSSSADVTIEALMAGRLIQPLFQPIVDLSTGLVVGLEALARGPAGTVLEFPDRLFAAAHAAGRLGELDMLCAERALECAVAAPDPPPLLFVNAEPAVLDQPLSPRLLELIRAGLPFREILEFTERALTSVPGSLLRIAGQVQEFGNSIALDDVGVDPMSLALVPVLEPEVIKLDMGLLRNPDAEHTRMVCTVVRAEADRTGALVVAEGIETEADLATARRLGAGWGQGWLFGRPSDVGQTVHCYDPVAASVLRPPRPGFHRTAAAPFDIAATAGKAEPATAATIAAALAVLRDLVAADNTAVVVASVPARTLPGVAVAAGELFGRARSMVLLDEPISGEFAAVVIGPGYGSGVSVRWAETTQLLRFDQLPAVAAVARSLLNQLR